MRSLILSVLVVALLALPAASAASQPVVYFLKDGQLGPVGPGILNGTAPDSPDPSARPVLPGTPDTPTAEWHLSEPPTTDILGPVIVAVWPGPSLVASGNLSATLYAVDGTTYTALASASINIDTNTSETPDPTVLVPPDPTDPPGAAAHVIGQALAMTLQPPLVLQLGDVNASIPEGQVLSLGLYMEAAEGGAVPAGAASVQYDGQLNPSFLYVPWYVPDPEPSETSTTTASDTTSDTTTSTTQSGSVTLGPTESPSDGKQSPGLGLIAAITLVGIAAAVVRRRL